MLYKDHYLLSYLFFVYVCVVFAQMTLLVAYLCVWVCVCACARARVCMCVFACLLAYLCVRVCKVGVYVYKYYCLCRYTLREGERERET